MRLLLPNRVFKFTLKKERTFLGFFKRKYSLIKSVNINNWDHIHKEIIQKIKECDFISIDVEYTGLHLKDERYVSIDASYEAHCYGAKSFFPCQIGLTVARKVDCYKEKEEETKWKKQINNDIKEQNEIEKNNKWNEKNKKFQRWEISPYSIYVFPKENKYFKVSTTTLIFLRENNFDFNEWIFKGVGYLTPSEEKEKKKFLLEKKEELQNLLNKCNTINDKPEQPIDIKRIISDIQNNKIVDEEDKEPIVEIIKKIDVWFNKGHNQLSCKNSIIENNTSRILKDSDENKETQAKEKLISKKISNENEKGSIPTYSQAVHSEALSHHINEEYEEEEEKKTIPKDINNEDLPLYIEIDNPYLRLLAHTLITKYFHSLFCISIKVNDKKHLALYKTEKDTYKEQIKTVESEIEKINKTVGVRLLFDEIIKKKKVIIGHNCFYDILHIYQTFYNELPKTINEFKEKWTHFFSYTFDTKFINETNEHLQLLNGPSTLKGLCEYMGSLISVKENDIDFFFHFEKDDSHLPQCFRSFIQRNQFLKKENNAKEEMEISEEGKKETNKNQDLSRDTYRKYDNEVATQSDEHNAGYDSLLTCFLFIFQCHHILKKNNLRWSDVHFYRTSCKNDSNKSIETNKKNMHDDFMNNNFLDIFSNMANKIKLVKTQPNVISLTNKENCEMERHFYMYDYPSYFKKWEIMKIWSPMWITLSKIDDQSCWIIAKSDEDAKNIKMIYKMLQNPQFKLCTYEEYLEKFKNN